MQSAAATRADAARKGETADTTHSPVRVLVQTYTHLVPGEARPDKLEFLRKTIAKRVLKMRHNKSTAYMHVYDDLFAIPGRQCFFLYDYASTPIGDDIVDDEIPILWYRWSGDKMMALNQKPPKRIRRTIREDYPFMIRVLKPKLHDLERPDMSKEELKRHRMKETPEERTKRRRELEQAKLRRLDYLYDHELQWLSDEPEHEAWLQANVEPRAWSWYQRLKAEWIEIGRVERLVSTARIGEFP
ncbi:hypothetical protein KVR01_002503 [Diaporthe batatas]|uniref:uncharacterized protein n=1 Tax=Diaporthe batatas TaxID=748121 RepID=UPI001D048711|nr:uncharacterized protein KVR01_002503 [Diaporthe batatas]KAG8166814.1 hypothetical protein KVR01_002503 [Diaporthe batatas]